MTEQQSKIPENTNRYSRPYEALDTEQRNLIIIDDLMDETDQRVASVFTKKSHHRNISVMYIVQNLFHKGKYHRAISLNAHYMVLFKTPRDVSQIYSIAQQMFPRNSTYRLQAFAAATSEKPHGYLLIDMKQQTPDRLRLRSHIFPGEKQTVYLDEKNRSTNNTCVSCDRDAVVVTWYLHV
jgi:hypothetical protein